MQKASEIKVEVPSLFLFVGPFDSGKSYAASSWGLKSLEYGGDDPRPCYVYELDGRLAALRNRPVEFNAFTNEDGAVGVLRETNRLREACIKFGRSPCHTLIFDSFTSFGDFSIADSLEVTELHNKNNKGEQKGRKRGELQLLTTEDYGYEAEAVRQLVWEDIIDIKKYCNVIMIAHEVMSYRVVKGTAPGAPTTSEPDGYKILMHGNKIAARLPTRFDEIYHFMPKEVIHSKGGAIRRQVCFQDEMARTSYPTLMTKLGKHDITGIEFYTWWKKMVEA